MADHTLTREPDTEQLIAEYARTKSDKVRTEIIERHSGLVRSLASKFARPGVPMEDLAQSAWIALIRALDRFDPSYDTKFTTYAVTCMVGEIKRYFRDRTWSVKAPRYLQEIASSLHRVQDELYQKLQREPTMGEMATAFGVTEEDVMHAMELYRCYQMDNLEGPREAMEGSESRSLEEGVGESDSEISTMVDFAPLSQAIDSLEERQQQIIRRRYYDGFTQQEVAKELGLSQMHVSRLERAALADLRARIREMELT